MPLNHIDAVTLQHYCEVTREPFTEFSSASILLSRRQFWGRAAGRLQPSGWQALLILGCSSSLPIVTTPYPLFPNPAIDLIRNVRNSIVLLSMEAGS